MFMVEQHHSNRHLAEVCVSLSVTHWPLLPEERDRHPRWDNTRYGVAHVTIRPPPDWDTRDHAAWEEWGRTEIATVEAADRATSKEKWPQGNPHEWAPGDYHYAVLLRLPWEAHSYPVSDLMGDCCYFKVPISDEHHLLAARKTVIITGDTAAHEDWLEALARRHNQEWRLTMPDRYRYRHELLCELRKRNLSWA